MFDKILVVMLVAVVGVFLRLTMEESQKQGILDYTTSWKVQQILSGTVWQNTAETTQEPVKAPSTILQRAQKNNITTAKSLAEFQPNNFVTRGQFAKMLVTYLASVDQLKTDERDANCLFSDFEEAGEFSLYIYDACTNWLMKGTNGYFYPQNFLSVAEIIVTLIRIEQGKELSQNTTPRYKNYAERAKTLKIINYNDINVLQNKTTRLKTLELLRNFDQTQK